MRPTCGVLAPKETLIATGTLPNIMLRTRYNNMILSSYLVLNDSARLQLRHSHNRKIYTLCLDNGLKGYSSDIVSIKLGNPPCCVHAFVWCYGNFEKFDHHNMMPSIVLMDFFMFLGGAAVVKQLDASEKLEGDQERKTKDKFKILSLPIAPDKVAEATSYCSDLVSTASSPIATAESYIASIPYHIQRSRNTWGPVRIEEC